MSGTRRTVFRLWIALLAATLATLAGAAVATDLGRRDANALLAGEAPAREGLAAARQSLVEADTEALNSFWAQQPPVGAPSAPAKNPGAGAGEAYRTSIAAAGRQLAQVSRADIGGPAAEAVQVMNGLLITYDGLVQQAFRGDPGALLSKAYLQYAHEFLGDELLAQLDTLVGMVDKAVSERPPWGRHLLWALPLIALAGLLAAGQVWLSRRFRRTLSAPLLAATLVTVVLGVTAVLSLDADREITAGRQTLTTLVETYQARADAAAIRACESLREMRALRGQDQAGCATAPPAATDRQLLTMANSVSTTAQSAAAKAGRSTVTVIVVALLTGLLITLGLLPRIEEYRFRRR